MKKPFYKKWWSWVIGLIVFFLVVSSFGSKSAPQAAQTDADATQNVASAQPVEPTASPEKTASTNQPSAPAPKPETATPPAQPKQISYKVVDGWALPNGGEGKVVVITPDLVNETDMIALGEKLKSDAQSARNSFVYVFDDASAAASRSKVMNDTATAAEQDFYGKHFVAQYTKNGNTGFQQFAIYFDGVDGTNQKTITY